MSQIPERRQIVFNWLFGDDTTKTDGWWGGSNEVKRIDELLAALDAAVEAALDEARKERDTIRSKFFNSSFDDSKTIRLLREQVTQQAAQIAELTRERDEYKWMYEGLCK